MAARTAALAVLAAALGAALPAWAGASGTDEKPAQGRRERPAASKKAERLAVKARAAAPDEAARSRLHRELERRVGKPPPGVINVYNTWTREMLVVDARSPESARAITGQALGAFLRCHFTNQPASMDARLFAAIIDAANHFGASRIDIVSGFRSPKYNLILRKKGREVARNSQHTQGSAVDFRIPGVSVQRLHQWARRRRLGGVGYYPSSGFVHMDTGRVRYWTGE